MGKIGQHIHRIQDLEQQLLNNDETITLLQDMNDRLSDDAKQREIHNLCGQLKQKDLEISRLTAESKAINEAKGRIQMEVTRLENEISELRSLNSTLKTANEEMTKAMQMGVEENVELKETVCTLMREKDLISQERDTCITTLKERVSELEATGILHSQTTNSLNEQIAMTRSDLARTRFELSDSQQRMASVIAEKDAYWNKTVYMGQDLTYQRDQHNAEIKKMQEAMTQLTLQHQKLIQSFAAKLDEVQRLHEALRLEKDTISRLEIANVKKIEADRRPAPRDLDHTSSSSSSSPTLHSSSHPSSSSGAHSKQPSTESNSRRHRHLKDIRNHFTALSEITAEVSSFVV
jgi:hypothetical protein